MHNLDGDRLGEARCLRIASRTFSRRSIYGQIAHEIGQRILREAASGDGGGCGVAEHERVFGFVWMAQHRHRPRRLVNLDCYQTEVVADGLWRGGQCNPLAG
ncbi:MAG: hypothetical protein HC828_18575, partial [Blastochloris sp.]|nr:hypothetical protein [Blastochloris sp.]